MRVIRNGELEKLRTLHDDLVIEGDCGTVLEALPANAFDMVYIDPPFNTGKRQTLRSIRANRDEAAGTAGFGGRRYSREVLSALSYEDSFDDFIEFIAPRLVRARELLADHGTLYFHIDYREAHYCKVLLDQVFGRECFLNEIIWAYDYGARTNRRWPAKHDTILVYVKDP